MGIKSIISAMALKTKIIVISATVLVAGTVATVVGVSLNKEEAYRVIKVFEMTGEAVVTRSGTGDLDAYVGMNLESGDTLVVGDDSTLRISMDSDKYVLLDGGTVLELTATGSSSDSRTVINLKQGTILNELTNPLSANSSYEVSTPKSTMAVRGTSFIVSVEEQSDGSFITTESTLQGKVEVELLDKDGNPTGNTALVTPDTSVTILTEPDETSGKPADEDGTSSFVKEGEDGSLVPVGADESPLNNIDYDNIPDSLRGNAIRSNDENLMLLNDTVIRKLRGEEEPEETTTETTTAPVTEPTTETEVTTVPTEVTYPEETTTEETTVPEETTVTTVATTVPEETTTEETTVPEETTTEETSETTETTTKRSSTPSTPSTPTVETGTLILTNTDGSEIDRITIEDGDTYTLPSPPTGNMWKNSTVFYSGGDDFTYSKSTYGDSVTLTAVEAYNVTIHYIDETGASATKVVKAEAGTLLSSLVPNITVPDGWKRLGWFFTGTTTEIGSSVVSGDTEIYEERKDTVTVIFYDSDGTTSLGRTVVVRGEPIKSDNVPSPNSNYYSKYEWLNMDDSAFDLSTPISATSSGQFELKVKKYVKIKFLYSVDTTKDRDVEIPAGTTLLENSIALPPIDAYHEAIGTGWYIPGGENIDINTPFSKNTTVRTNEAKREYNINFTCKRSDGSTALTGTKSGCYDDLVISILSQLMDEKGIVHGGSVQLTVNSSQVTLDKKVQYVLDDILHDDTVSGFNVDVLLL